MCVSVHVCVSGGHQTQKTYRTLPFKTVDLGSTNSFGSDGKTLNPHRAHGSPSVAQVNSTAVKIHLRLLGTFLEHKTDDQCESRQSNEEIAFVLFIFLEGQAVLSPDWSLIAITILPGVHISLSLTYHKTLDFTAC